VRPFATRLARALSWASVSDRAAFAVEQAVLDWRHERFQAHSRLARATCALRLFGACFRIGASVLATEIIDIVSSGWMLRLSFWIAATMWFSYSPVDSSRPSAGAVNLRLFWVTLASSVSLAPVLTLFTAPSAIRAPVMGLGLLGIAASAVIHQLVLPSWLPSVPGFSSISLPWNLIALSSLMTYMLIVIADRVRTDRRRWSVTAVLLTLPLLQLAQANAIRFAVWLSDVGIVTGDVVYLPKLPVNLAALWYSGPWLGLAVIVVTLTWLVHRRIVAERSTDGPLSHSRSLNSH
jgi:hypothetical protein